MIVLQQHLLSKNQETPNIMKVKINIFLIMLLGIIEYCSAQENIDLFIWAGQSNAQGWKGDADFYPTDPNNLDSSIRFNYTFINNSSSNGWITMQPQTGRYTPQGHFGPEVSFSRKLKEAGYNPAIFKYCLGGTSLYGNWKTPGEGGYYDNMVIKLNAAIKALEDQGHTVNVRGFVWIQGESDANNITNAKAYKKRLLTLINDLRDTIVKNSSLPIILGVDEQHSGVVAQPSVLNAHQHIAQNDSTIIFTSMYGLPKADATHLTPTGLIAHGEQIFESFISLLSGEAPSSSCTISSNGSKISGLEEVSWGQSFKLDCSGTLSEITFNSATNLNSSLTISISNGSDCNATLLYTQTISKLVDGDNLVSISNPVQLDKEHTYYINIASNTNEVWRVRFNQSSQVIGNLRTSLKGEASSTCNRNFYDFDLSFSVVIDGNITGIDNKKKLPITEYIYPNPSKGVVNIYLNSLKNVSIKVINAKGSMVYYESNINTVIHKIDLSNIQSGIYFIQINSEEHQQYNKLILE